jgi:small subunit ribosomal protein S4
MARYTGPKLRLERREGTNLGLKGKRGLSDKHPFKRGKNYPPGVHGPKGRRRMTDYAVHLREKQKTKRMYGVMERQFRRYFEIASKSKGQTGLELLRLLETRLDNVIFRLGFGATRAQARQFVTHGHVLVNGERVDIPSYKVKPGDEIQLVTKLAQNPVIAENIELQPFSVNWITRKNNFSGVVDAIPERTDIDSGINEAYIVEFYSR